MVPPGAETPASGPVPEPPAPSAPEAAAPEPLPTIPEEPQPDGRLLEYADLPPAILSQFPALRVSGHVWSEEPEFRMLTVQDRLVKEGGEVFPGVRLEEITQEGGVFSYKGYRFKITGF